MTYFKIMNKLIWVFFIALVSVSSCKKEEKQDDIDDKLIQEYITNNNITNEIKTEFGVYYMIDSLGDGSGIYPSASSTVRVHYRGYFLDGTEFDSGNFGTTPINLQLVQTIGGWQIGLPFFEKGTTGRLLIPSRYGYGSTPRAGVPVNSVLAFDIELVNVFD
jgi:FKBP-type peptidyl-prolyl cis-trans isomerase